ncbi:MAG: xylulokinase [Clostridiales bacterium]|nr:xylulokinase [Clostridiales bacterium]
MGYLIGIDLGTSGTKTVLFQDGIVKASASAEYPLMQKQNGWAEQNPEDWWYAVCQTLQSVLKSSDVHPTEIGALGISGQMHGLVMLDKNGEVLRPSILWCDGRTGEECKEITDRVGRQRLMEIAANPALPGFTAGKILWVRRHEPAIYEKCAQILLPKDFIRYKLCGVFATEVSDASGTNLLDVQNRCWSEEILHKLNIEKSLLPTVYESCEVTGQITEAASRVTGLAAGMPVVGGAGDNAAAAVGTGVVTAGKAFTTIGTSGVVFAHADHAKIDPQGRIHTFCSAVPGGYAAMSCTLAAGLSLQWFRNQFCQAEIEKTKETGIDPYVLMNEEAARSPIGANRLIYLPYLMGERSPLLDEKARGVFFGLSAMQNRGDLIRSVMEGVLYAQKQCLDIFGEMNIAPTEMIACGGGAKSPLWRQMMADIYGCDVLTVPNPESPALGAALLAGVGSKEYASVQEACEAVIGRGERVSPNDERTTRYNAFYDIYKALYPALKKQFANLALL